MNSGNSISILLVDDHVILREGLRRLLEENGNYEIVGETDNGLTAFELARELDPDVVLMDVGLPKINGVEATRKICANLPGIKVIGLSMHSDSQFVTAMLKAGASAYLLKEAAFDEIHVAVKSVLEGKTYLSPTVAGAVVSNLLDQDEEKAPGVSRLSPRERQVLQLLAEGNSTAKIGEALHISAKTVETHRKNIMEKLEMYTIAELTKFAIRAGITSLEA